MVAEVAVMMAALEETEIGSVQFLIVGTATLPGGMNATAARSRNLAAVAKMVVVVSEVGAEVWTVDGVDSVADAEEWTVAAQVDAVDQEGSEVVEEEWTEGDPVVAEDSVGVVEWTEVAEEAADLTGEGIVETEETDHTKPDYNMSHVRQLYTKKILFIY